jgi:cysteine desulfuration protein SufE
MKSLVEKQNDLVAEFSSLDNWEDRYKKIIALGKAMPGLPPEKKTEEAIVKGCQSQVWLHASLSEEGHVILEGDSDALIVKGLVAMLVKLYSESTPEEILFTPPDFIKKIGFEAHLSPSRSNGFFSMLKQIRHFAQAMTILKSMKKN